MEVIRREFGDLFDGGAGAPDDLEDKGFCGGLEAALPRPAPADHAFLLDQPEIVMLHTLYMRRLHLNHKYS